MGWKLWLGIGVSVVLLWVALRGVHFDEVARSFTEVHPWWLVPMVASLPARFWLTAVRWQLLLNPVKRVGIHRLFGITLIGFMANNILPARMGEFVRAYALGKSESLSKSLSFATIVLERVFDGFTLLAFLLIGSVFLNPGPLFLWSATIAFGLYLVVLGGLLWLRRGGGFGPVLRRLPLRFQQPVAELLESFALGLDALGDARALVAITGLSLLIWLVNVAGLHATFLAFSLHLPAYAGFLVLAIVALALTAPSTPGYVGPFQASIVVSLGLFGVSASTALSLSIVFHVINYVPITVAGFAYLGAMNLTLGELRAAGEKAS
jgi:glycosyltransferase 2 family protein